MKTKEEFKSLSEKFKEEEDRIFLLIPSINSIKILPYIEVTINILKGNLKEAIKRLKIYLCSKLEGECLLKKKDVKEVYKEIEKIFGNELSLSFMPKTKQINKGKVSK